MGTIKDSRTTANTIEHVAKHLSLDSDSNFTAAGTNTLSGATTISGALTASGAITYSAQQTKRVPVAKTASYQVTAADSGTTFTNRGDTDAITFTLPTTITAGLEYRFLCVADFDFAVTAASGKLVTFNNAAATSVKLGTTSEKIGGGFSVIADGTSWLCFIHAEETATVTVA